METGDTMIQHSGYTETEDCLGITIDKCVISGIEYIDIYIPWHSIVWSAVSKKGIK